jgi:hypothetical protein
MITDALADELGEDTDLDAENDLEYLLGLVGDAVENGDFEDDAARARWAVAHWCQEVGYLPDLRGYETGQIVPAGTVPENDELRLAELSPDHQADASERCGRAYETTEQSGGER